MIDSLQYCICNYPLVSMVNNVRVCKECGKSKMPLSSGSVKILRPGQFNINKQDQMKKQ